MDQKRRQILLAIVAVAALGAGGAYYLSRDSGANSTGKQNTVRTRRKVREKTATGAKTTKRSVRKAPRKKAVVTGRKDRGARAGPKSSSRKTRGRKKAKVKKAKRTPAA